MYQGVKRVEACLNNRAGGGQGAIWLALYLYSLTLTHFITADFQRIKVEYKL